MKKLLLLTKTLLAAVLLCVGQNAWAVDVPTPVYFNDFSSTTGLTQVGSGEFITDGDARFGQIYHNNPVKNKTARTNYLKLPEDVLTHSGTTNEMTIGFWVNMKDASGEDFFQCPVFSAYATSTPGVNNGMPMFRCSAKGVMQLNNNDGNWSDFTQAENDDDEKKTAGNTESTAYLDDAQWHYYTVTLTSNKGAIYVDGTVVNSWTLTSDAIIPAFFSTAAASGYPIVCLGGNQSWDWNDWDASFGYDDVAIYDQALSAEQIEKIIDAKLSTTVTFDFKSLTNQALPISSDLAVNANAINYMRPTVLNEELGYRFGFRYNSGDWSITDDGAKWNSSGNKDEDFAILNVKAGDIITFNIASGTVFVKTANQINGTYYADAAAIKAGTTTTGDLTVYAALISGNAYTVKYNGNLYFQAKRKNWNTKDVSESAKDYCVISSVTIQTTSTETVTSPTISFAVKDTKRTITLTSGTSSISSGVTTYYTIDGTTPTALSTKYTGSFDIDATKTIKAVTISNSSIATSSTVTSQEVTAGEALTLKAPTVTMDLNAVGDYYIPTYTFNSDQSSLGIYAPASVTLSYSVAGGATVEAGSFTPTTTGGSVTVTVSADGYTSANTVFNVPAIVYTKVTTLDFTTATYPSGSYITTTATKEGTAYETGNKRQQDIYAVSEPSALSGYMAFQGVYNGTSGSKGWWIRSNYGGLYTISAERSAAVLGRSTADIVAFNCSQDAANVMTYLNGSQVPDGNYTMLKSSNSKTYYATMTADGKVGFCGVKGVGYIASIVIYSPINAVTATIGSTGWTTFSSGYAVDLSNMTASEGDVTAYYASETSAESVIMTPTNSSAVIANEGLMLKGTAGATITIPVAASPGSALPGNKLVGCYNGETLSKDASKYVLVKNGGTAEFQSLKDNGATIPAGKAYLDVSLATPARALRIAFASDITGINEAQATSETKAQEGKFIENGKLVIVKNGKKFNANGAILK